MAQSHGAASSQEDEDDNARQLTQPGYPSNHDRDSQAVQPSQWQSEGPGVTQFASTASTEFPEQQGDERQVEVQHGDGEQVDAQQGDEQQTDEQQAEIHQGDEQQGAEPQRDERANDEGPPHPEQPGDEEADNDVESTPDDASEGSGELWFPPERHAIRETRKIDDSFSPTEDSGLFWPSSETMAEVDLLFSLARNPGTAGFGGRPRAGVR